MHRLGEFPTTLLYSPALIFLATYSISGPCSSFPSSFYLLFLQMTWVWFSPTFLLVPMWTFNIPFWALRCQPHSDIVVPEVIAEILIPSVCGPSRDRVMHTGHISGNSFSHCSIDSWWPHIWAVLLDIWHVFVLLQIIPPSWIPPFWIYEVLN